MRGVEVGTNFAENEAIMATKLAVTITENAKRPGETIPTSPDDVVETNMKTIGTEGDTPLIVEGIGGILLQ